MELIRSFCYRLGANYIAAETNGCEFALETRRCADCTFYSYRFYRLFTKVFMLFCSSFSL